MKLSLNSKDVRLAQSKYSLEKNIHVFFPFLAYSKVIESAVDVFPLSTATFDSAIVLTDKTDAKANTENDDNEP